MKKETWKGIGWCTLFVLLVGFLILGEIKAYMDDRESAQHAARVAARANRIADRCVRPEATNYSTCFGLLGCGTTSAVFGTVGFFTVGYFVINMLSSLVGSYRGHRHG